MRPPDRALLWAESSKDNETLPWYPGALSSHPPLGRQQERLFLGGFPSTSVHPKDENQALERSHLHKHIKHGHAGAA